MTLPHRLAVVEEEPLTLKQEIEIVAAERLSRVQSDVREWLRYCALVGMRRVRLDDCELIRRADLEAIATWLSEEGFEVTRRFGTTLIKLD